MSETPTMYEREPRRARKEHQCCECLKVIRPGASYVISSGLWDGQWAEFKQCAACAERFDQLVADDQEPIFGEVAEYEREMVR